MPPAVSFFSRSRLALPAGLRHRLGIGVLVLLHVVAVAVLLHTEDDLIARLAFLFTWGLLNFLWLLLLRRPSVAASLSLIMVVVLILLSQFKQDILIMSANFVDVMLIDGDTARSEERRVGKECRSRGSPHDLKKKNKYSTSNN